MCPPDSLLHRWYLIPMGHEKMVAPKDENAFALAFTSITWRTNFGVAPKTRNIGSEGKQSWIWWRVGSREGRRRKQERETCASIPEASSWYGSGNLGLAGSKSCL